jgi:hypothetical protein
MEPVFAAISILTELHNTNTVVYTPKGRLYFFHKFPVSNFKLITLAVVKHEGCLHFNEVANADTGMSSESFSRRATTKSMYIHESQRGFFKAYEEWSPRLTNRQLTNAKCQEKSKKVRQQERYSSSQYDYICHGYQRKNQRLGN